MGLMLDIGFRIRWAPNAGGGVSVMDDDTFIRDLKETLTRRADAEEERVKRENREFDLVAAKAPGDWGKLKAWLKERTAQLPAELVSYQEELNSIEIRYRIPRGMRTTQVVFRQLDKFATEIVVTAKGGVLDGDFTFECGIEAKVLIWFYATNQKVRFDIPGMGKVILTEATRG
jgi:hypothetical protein